MNLESTWSRAHASSWRDGAGIAASCMLGVAVNLTYMTLPVMLGVAADAAHLDEQQVGWLGSVEVTGMLLGSLVFSVLLRPQRLRALGLLALIAVVGGALALLSASTFAGAAMARAVGGFGAGLGNSLSVVCVGYTLAMVRNQGLLNASIIFSGAICLSLFGSSGERWGVGGVVWPIILVAGIALFGLPFLPGPRQAVSRETRDTTSSPTELLAPASTMVLGIWLLATTLSHLAPAAGWVYAERIGIQVGLSGSTVGMLLTVASLLSAACCLAAHRLSTRWGSVACTALCIAGLLLGFASWGLPAMGPAGYGVRIALISMFWALLTVFQITGMAALTPGARWMSVVPLAQNLGAAIGPSIGAALTGGHRSLQAAMGQCSLLLALPLLLVTVVAIGRRNTPPSQPLVDRT